MKYPILFVIFLLATPGLLLTPSAWAQEAQYPAYVGYVNDFADLLSSETEAQLNNLIGELERKTTAQIAIITLDTIAPETIEGYAVKLFKKWGIGQKGKDNGVLILVAVKERKTRIEVGYGLEGAIPDAKAFAIYKKIMVPHFQAGDFDKGIARATGAVAGLIAQEYGVEIGDLASVPVYIKDARPQSACGKFLGLLFPLLLFILIFGLRMGLFGFLLLGSGHRRGGYWYGGGMGGSSGGFGGGFGGFGGGLSGGGGAGGGW